MNTLRFKCWYYDTALSAGTEDVPKNLPLEALPEDIRAYRYSDCLDSAEHKSL